jgi:hypothetical protein
MLECAETAVNAREMDVIQEPEWPVVAVGVFNCIVADSPF